MNQRNHKVFLNCLFDVMADDWRELAKRIEHEEETGCTMDGEPIQKIEFSKYGDYAELSDFLKKKEG